MQKFKYTAINIKKEKFSGIFIAEDEKDLAVQLAKQNLYLVSSAPYSGKTPSAFFTLGTGKVKGADLTTFCRQYAIMLTSGMSLLDSIAVLKSQPYSKFFKDILEIVYEDVKTGVMLSEALNKHKKVFPHFFRSMIKVGELSGKLDIVFTSLADYYEKDAKIKRKTASALAYPIMLLCFTLAIVVLMLTYIVPTFRNSLSQMEVPIEGITKTVYDLSDWLLANWLYVLAIIIVIVLILLMIGRTEKGKYFYDTLKIKLPLIGKTQTALITARFARGFALLLSSGMDVVDALDAIQIILGNRNVEERFKKATEEVRHGAKLSATFIKYKLFPDMLIQMITVGENTNSIAEVLNRTCGYFDEQVETTLNSLVSIIQPVMLILLALIVGTLFIAIYSPILSMMTSLGA